MKFGAKSLYGTFVISFLLNFSGYILLNPGHKDPLLASVYGGVVTAGIRQLSSGQREQQENGPGCSINS
jgi:hypothetical protein